MNCWVGWGSVVGIVTGYTLDDLGIKSRLGARYSTPVQTDLGAYPPFYTVGTVFPSQVYSSRGMALTTHPHLVMRLKKE